MLAGRKRDSPVWNFFSYDDSTGKSTCLVVEGDGSDACGVKLAGKNSSNLVAHLNRMHKEAFKAFSEKELLAKAAKQPVKRKADDPPLHTQTLNACFQRRVVSWASDSSEHKQREDSVVAMIIGSNSPLALVDQPSFRAMVRALDHKFNLPGK